MKFCPNDRTLLVPAKKGHSTVLRCPKCGYEEEASGTVKDAYTHRSSVSRKSDIIVSQGRSDAPTIKARCSRCGNEEAYVWMQQTRAADEPPTRFYRCTKCGYTWREYE